MRSYQLPDIKREQTVSFPGIPEERFDQTKDAMERDLRREIRENGMREERSIRYASDFVTTPPFGDE